MNPRVQQAQQYFRDHGLGECVPYIAGDFWWYWIAHGKTPSEMLAIARAKPVSDATGFDVRREK